MGSEYIPDLKEIREKVEWLKMNSDKNYWKEDYTIEMIDEIITTLKYFILYLEKKENKR